MAFEVVVGQLPHATVVATSRRTDLIRVGNTPAHVASMGQIPGYRPNACNHGLGKPVHPLCYGNDLVAKINTGGPPDPTQYEGNDGVFNMVGLCSAATTRGWKFLFAGE